jgi:hypothetical protein
LIRYHIEVHKQIEWFKMIDLLQKYLLFASYCIWSGYGNFLLILKNSWAIGVDIINEPVLLINYFIAYFWVRHHPIRVCIKTTCLQCRDITWMNICWNEIKKYFINSNNLLVLCYFTIIRYYWKEPVFEIRVQKKKHRKTRWQHSCRTCSFFSPNYEVLNILFWWPSGVPIPNCK